jgi:hypothetical protein
VEVSGVSSFGRVFFLGALAVGLSSPAAAVTYQVNAAAACPGSGTTAAPYCTIGNAAAVAAPGDIVDVAAGVYREQVAPPASGAAGLPITYRAAVGARIYGTNNLSGAGLWTLSSGTTYATPYNTPTNPAQVFADGNQLSAGASAGSVPVGGFFYDGVADTLFVNLGGDNPGNHDVEAGARSFGFSVDGKSHLVIEGFEVRGHNTNGIRVRSSANVVVRNNRVLRAASFGLVADSVAPATTGPVEISGNEVLENGSAGIRLRDSVTQATVRGNSSHHNRSHGLLATGITASVFESNRFFENALQGGNFTTGLRLDGSTGNVIQRNLAWGNQDTGFQVSAGSSNNLLVRNISYANQDHGYDIRQCDGPRLVSNTAWANVNDGFSIEDDVTNAYLRNNIGADNGLLTNGNDLWVDTTSAAGFSSDYDVFYRSSASGNTVEFNGGFYASVAAFAAATGNEAHGSGANPNFVNPGAGDFHPGLGPAIDSADASASGFAALDFDGLAPIDLTGVPDTGAGAPTYADRGALERRDAAPVARLTLTPKKAKIGQSVTANGSASSDDVGIVSYRFAWGDGTPDTVQAGPVATHVFTRKGNFKVKLTVTDGAGQTGSQQQVVQIGKLPLPSATGKEPAARRQNTPQAVDPARRSDSHPDASIRSHIRQRNDFRRSSSLSTMAEHKVRCAPADPEAAVEVSEMSSAGRVFLFGALLVALSSPASAVVYQVNAAAACPGSGTLLAPYCTIASAAAVAAPGDVINVAAGIYREQVAPPASGSAGLAITYRGAAGARIYGTLNLSGAGLWTLSSATTWATSYSPPTNPAQVFVDGNALVAAADAGAVPVGGFFYDTTTDVLYVNLGGDNPGNHDVEAGARSFGIAVEGRSHLVIEGFEVRGHNTNGIRVRGSDNVVVRNNRVLRAAGFGLVADGGTGPVELSGNELLENGDAGIRLRTNVFQATVSRNRSHHNRNHGMLVTNTTASVFAGNVVHDNARPGSVSTTGLLLGGDSDGNRVERNLAYGNQDTGIQVSDGADANVLARNISYANGDHGFDIRECVGPQLVSNTAWANTNDGFSIEGGVANAYLRNNIASDNGLLTGGNDLFVDGISKDGFSSDYDVFYRSAASGSTIHFDGAPYASVAAFTVTGNEANGSGANPNLVDPGAGDFHPGLGPAIDSADAGASGFAALDFDGLPPIDLTGVPDTGAGVPSYADRGALERRDAAPVARLVVTPKGKVKVGQLITANGSTSSDDVGIVSYRFGWGDGTPDTVQAGPVATHSFARKGNFKLRLTVTDGAGQANTVQQPVNVK